jgi:hypothetical protein
MMSMIHTAGRNNRNSRAVRTRLTSNAPRNNSNQPLVSGRTSTSSRRTTIGKSSMNAVSYLRGTERVVTLTIPITSKAGDLLYILEGNPNSAPRARAVASQFDSWSSPLELEVETTGNAFSKNFILIRHLPNGDPDRLPSPGQSLLNVAEAYDRRDESVKLQLDSNAKGVCRAPWSLSYNPRKPIEDTDPSERNLGLFIIVSNGSPGTEPVDITIRLRYNFRFYGPIYQPLSPNTSASLSGGSGWSASAPFPSNMILEGTGVISRTTSTITVQPGSYLMSFFVAGNTLAGSFIPTATGITFTSRGITSTASSSVATHSFATSTPATISYPGFTATSISNILWSLAPYNVSNTTVLSQPLSSKPISSTASAVNAPSTLESIANFAAQLNMIQGTLVALESLVGKVRRPRDDGADRPNIVGLQDSSEPPDPNRIG